MNKTVDIRIVPRKSEDEDYIRAVIAKKAKITKSQIRHYRIIKKSIDARGQDVAFQWRVELSDEPFKVDVAKHPITLQSVASAPECIIIGAGPAGYFAALELIEIGIKPIILERGKDVQARRRDLKSIQQEGVVNPDSNYCFGEGGAGTYSDGKLYTRSHKRGKIEKVLQWLVSHGAHPDILVDAHPHIGSNKLPKVVAAMRETIETHGGEIHFDTKVTDIVVEKGVAHSVILADGSEQQAKAIVLATGHSARDIFHILDDRGLRLEFKPFALGVRIEHPQALIDEIQYNKAERGPYLPAASYGMSCQIGQKGVFSFCMCPGGLIVPAATSPGEIVVNGMSLSRRDSPYANAGTVVEVSATDIHPGGEVSALDGVAFQSQVEKMMFMAGDGSQRAPAQRLTDFLETRISTNLPSTSYIPGIFSAPVNVLLPHFVYEHLHDAILVFGRKMKGYLTEEAIVVGTESRTSSPVKIPRDAVTLMHPDAKGLFPCGEGGGYAGGIVSAAMDGQRVARAVATFYN